MATNQKEADAEIDKLYPIYHFCPHDGSAMEHLELRGYICLKSNKIIGLHNCPECKVMNSYSRSKDDYKNIIDDDYKNVFEDDYYMMKNIAYILGIIIISIVLYLILFSEMRIDMK